MAKPEPQSFEKQEYEEDRKDLLTSAIHQAAREIERTPVSGIMVKTEGDSLRLLYHCYEMHAHRRFKEIESLANDALNSGLSQLKKEVKKISRQTLDLKEQKDKRDYTVQKVSLNERYYVVFWRVYEIS